MPGLLHALGCKIPLGEEQSKLAALMAELIVLRGRGTCPGHISPTGAVHLRAEAIKPWYQHTIRTWYKKCVIEGDIDAVHKYCAEVYSKLRSYTWWLDVVAYDRDDWFNGGRDGKGLCDCHDGQTVQSRCRSLWSGCLAAPLFLKMFMPLDDEDPPTLPEFGIRFPLDEHIRELGTGFWRHRAPECIYPRDMVEFRIFCLDPGSLQVVLHADTRRAYHDEYAMDDCAFKYVFASPKCTDGALEFNFDAMEDADGDGCMFRALDFHVSDGASKGGIDGW